MNKKIIGLVGFIGSGKGTVGDYLVSNHNFRSVSFASTLKDAVASIFGWPRHLLEGTTEESRLWREQTDPFWSRKLAKPVTPRWVLQTVGTDVLRNQFEDNIWIWSLERQLTSVNSSVVVTDVRFPNEIKMIESLGGHLWWVQRGQMPEWITTAMTNKIEMKSKYPSVHSSEYEWLGAIDYTIINNNTDINSLHMQVDKCLKI